MKKLSLKIKENLSSGMSPRCVSLAVSIGVLLGLFPIYGPFSLLCIGLAACFRLNLPLILAGYYSMALIKPLLILPFLRAGEGLFRADPMAISLPELARRFGVDAYGTLAEFGWSFLHAVAGWLLAVPFLFLLLFPVTLFLTRRIRAGLVKQDGLTRGPATLNAGSF